MDPLLVELRNITTKRRPAKLLVVGVPVESLDAGEIRAADTVPDDPRDAGSFALVIYRTTGPALESELSKIADLMAERSRLILAIPATARRDSILHLSRRGFAVHDERAVSDGDLHMITARSTDFVVRPFEEGDERDILRMFKPSFHVERSLDHWRWKYVNQPYGAHHITVARAPNGELAAHYAGYPVTFSHFQAGGKHAREERWQALQIGDTMTHPQYRGVGRAHTGLLGRCIRHFFANHCDEGRIGFNFGVNTGNIQKLTRRLVGVEPVERVGYWIRPIVRPNEVDRSYRIIKPKTVDRRWDRFFSKVGPHYRFLVRRDAQWLQWRYLQCPDDPPFLLLAARRWGRIVGWGVFRRDEDRLRWCDALFDPRHVEATWSMLQAAIDDPSMEGTQRVEAWFPSRPEWWRRQLVELGFEPAQQPDDLAWIAAAFGCEHALDLLQNQYYYTMGDSDLA